MNIMNPYHPEWETFVERLEGIEGCYFRKDPEKGVVWNCGRDGDQLGHTRMLLKNMILNVEQSLAVFEACGGHCDCEVLFNVKDSFGQWFPDNPTEQDIDKGIADQKEWLDNLLTGREDTPRPWAGS